MDEATIPGGLLVAIEGIDGAGKTTLARALAAEYSAGGVKVHLSKEPTQGQYGSRLRASAATGRLSAREELELLLQDRHEHVSQLIQPALERGEIVVLDRYYLSNVAYQGAAGLDVKELLRLNEAFAPKPDLVLLLDLPVEVGLKRIQDRGDEANAFEQPESLTAARRIFLDAAKRDAEHTVVIDATQSPAMVQDLASKALVERATIKIAEAYGVTPAAVEATRRFVGPALI